jgi:hypothetical protein
MSGNRILAIVLTATAAVTGACSIANTGPDQVALQYEAGPFDSKGYYSCVNPSTRAIHDVNDDHFYYPAGQRTYKFSTDPGSDAPALTVSTKDQIELIARGTITFTLNVSCDQYTDSAGKQWPGGKLQKFHETIGRKFGAYTTEDDQGPNDGWRTMLGVYLRDTADRAIDNAGLTYSWVDLYSNADQKKAWEDAVVKAIPDLIKSQMGEDFLVINSIILQKPDIPDQLKGEITNRQAATQRAQTSKIDQEAAAGFAGGLTAYLAYQNALAVNEAIKSGKVQVIPVPSGSPVIVQPQAR